MGNKKAKNSNLTPSKKKLFSCLITMDEKNKKQLNRFEKKVLQEPITLEAIEQQHKDEMTDIFGDIVSMKSNVDLRKR